DRVRARTDRGPHQGFLSRGVEHGDLHHHGDRAHDQARRAVRHAAMSAIPGLIGAARQNGLTHQRTAFFVMFAFFLVAPFVAYPIFLMKVMCFALFACAFNLLIGYGGLVSFGHAMFLGTAGYASAHAAKVWGFPPELAILFGTACSAALGFVTGLL